MSERRNRQRRCGRISAAFAGAAWLLGISALFSPRWAVEALVSAAASGLCIGVATVFLRKSEARVAEGEEFW